MRIDRRRLLTLAAAGAAPVAGCAQPRAPVAFNHGVASGDPTTDGILLWTRVTPTGTPDRVEVAWEIGEDATFARIVAKGVAQTGPQRDYTVKAEATGLSPGRDYRYRFRADEAVSPVGRTRTLPTGHLPKLVLAAASCALYPAGRFNAYRHMAEGPPLDAIIHLGDYMYEYRGGPSDYGGAGAAERHRTPEPQHEVVTLADYRIRHALYKADPDLQAAHAAAPWICTWDDHDVANDDWMGGAENHQPATEGTWAARKGAALQAYYEWMPLREPGAGKAKEAIFRAFEFGDLVTLAMLETRLTARSQQATAKDPDLKAKLSDPSRRLMGPDQEAWLNGVLKASVAARRPWQLIGNQILMARVDGPDLYQVLGRETVDAAPPASREAAQRLARQYAGGVPTSYDSWDGYPVARERLYAGLRQVGGEILVMSGDTHAAWVNILGETAAPVGIELGVTAVSSPSMADSAPDLDIGSVAMSQNESVLFSDQRTKGYLRLTLTPEAALAEMVETGVVQPFTAKTAASFRVTKGAKVERLT